MLITVRFERTYDLLREKNYFQHCFGDFFFRAFRKKIIIDTLNQFAERLAVCFELNQNKILNLHWTFSEADFDVSLPTLFSATHWYSPLSVLFTFVIVNCFLSSAKLILPLAFRGDSSLVHDIVGTGFPVALQDKVTLCPSVMVSPSG